MCPRRRGQGLVPRLVTARTGRHCPCPEASAHEAISACPLRRESHGSESAGRTSRREEGARATAPRCAAGGRARSSPARRARARLRQGRAGLGPSAHALRCGPPDAEAGVWARSGPARRTPGQHHPDRGLHLPRERRRAAGAETEPGRERVRTLPRRWAASSPTAHDPHGRPSQDRPRSHSAVTRPVQGDARVTQDTDEAGSGPFRVAPPNFLIIEN